VSEGRSGTPFKGWQWAEVVLAALLIWTQIILQLIFNQLLASGLVGVLLLGLIVHMATWLIPLVRIRRAEERLGRTGALLGHGERPWVIVSGLCVLLLGILMGCAAVLDLMANGYHQDAPAGVGWAIGVLVFGFVVTALGNILVQSERIRVRRKTP
jgi:hypothetical protein